MRTCVTAALLLSIASLSVGCPPGRRDAPDRRDVVITSMSPVQGPRTGGTLVILEGSGFGARPFVTLGAAIVEDFQLVTDERIEFVSPGDNVGPASLTLVNEDGGRATLVGAWFYLPVAPVAYARRWFADSPTEAGANPVLVTSTGEVITQIDIAVPRAETGAIAGRLTDGAGAPLAGHDVVATSLTDGVTVATLTSVDGRYRLEGLFPGSWTVRSDESADSDLADLAWPGVSNSLDAEAVPVLAGSTTQDVDLALDEGGTIRGVVAGGRTPIAGAIVSAVPVVANPLQFAYDVTAADGRFELRGLAPGEYRLSASAFGSGRVAEYWPGSVAAGGATPVTVTAGGETVADFDLDAGGAISGQVLETPTLAPQAGTVILAHAENGLSWSTGTSGTGTWRIGELPPGDYRIEAPELGQWYGGVTSSAASIVVTVTAGAEQTDVSFAGRLGEVACGDPGGTGTVSGEVADRDGDPLARVDVQLVPTSGGALAFAVTGQDGAWTADCVEPGTYLVQFVPSNRDRLAVTVAGVAVGTGTVGGVDAVLPPGAILRGTIRDATTFAPLRSVPVRVRHTSTGLSAIVQTGSDGRWRSDRTALGGLSPGTWRVEALPHVQSEHSPY